MYLKTLELYGFKSFPDKTVISFEPGMTVVVGANGSGKSNISDAVRFVLGEMSPKALRGSKMEDIIFNGTQTRKSANFAEVTMVIADAAGKFRAEGDELSVSRRLYRSGESEYKLNGVSARLKDVVETFLDSGIGREGYSVIGQGKISDILSAKGSDRRDIFEEAAGISKYRYRKTDAQNKLSGVAENEVRIADILAEVEERLPHVEKQAKRAEEYFALSDRRKALELALFSEQLAAGSEEKDALLAELDAENEAYRKVCDACEVLDRSLDKLYLETQEENLAAEKLRTEIIAAAGRQSELFSALSVLENDIHHLELRGVEAQRALEELLPQAEVANAQETAAKEAFEAADRESNAADGALSGARAHLLETESALAAAQAAREALRAEVEKLSSDLHQKELGAREQEVLFEAQRAQAQTLRKQAQEDEKALSALQAEGAAVDAALAQKKKAVEQAQAALAEGRARKDDCSRRCATLEKGLSAERETLAVMHEKRASLERLRRQFEGYPESVRALMQASEAGALSGLFGPVLSLFSAPDAYAKALETALGAAAQHIVCADEGAAKTAIAYLKANRAGRATFLPLTTVDRRVENFDNIRDKGFVGSALSLSEFDAQYLPVAEYLLGRCAVAQDLDAATRIAAARSFRLKVVTLDGQVIHAGGSFTGGQSTAGARLLTREKDIAALDADILRAEKICAKQKTEIAAARAEENEISAAVSALQSALEQANLALFEARSQAELWQERFSEKESALSALQEKIALLSDRHTLQTEAAALAEIKDALAAQKEAFADMSEAYEALVAATQAAREQADAHTQNAAEKSRVKAQAATQRDLAAAKAGSLAQNIRELEASKLGFLKELESAKAKIAASVGEKETMSSQSQSLDAQLEAKKTHLAALEKESFDLRAKQKESASERETMLAAIQVKAAKLERLQSEHALYLTRLSEEYELDEDALAGMKIEPGTAKSLGGKSALSRLRAELRRMGPINEEAPAEFAALSERQRFLRTQYEDIVEAKAGLENLILSLEKTMRELFLSTFEKLRETFRQTFREFFEGGNADILLTDRNDLLNCAIEIHVQPPGKNVKNLSLLSGGEQTFVAIALYLSLLQVNPSPFCIFDEIESNLDETNVARFADYIKRHSQKTQFLIISHRRGTMEQADVLYGITMQERGVSDYIRLAVGEVGAEYETE